MLSTQAAGQSPAAGGDMGHLGNGLHLLWTAYTHLRRKTKQLVRNKHRKHNNTDETHLTLNSF